MAPTGLARAARIERKQHLVSRLHAGHTFADGIHDAGALVAENGGELQPHRARGDHQIGMADARCLDCDADFAGLRLRHVDGLDRERAVGLVRERRRWRSSVQFLFFRSFLLVRDIGPGGTCCARRDGHTAAGCFFRPTCHCSDLACIPDPLGSPQADLRTAVVNTTTSKQVYSRNVIKVPRPYLGASATVLGVTQISRWT